MATTYLCRLDWNPGGKVKRFEEFRSASSVKSPVALNVAHASHLMLGTHLALGHPMTWRFSTISFSLVINS